MDLITPLALLSLTTVSPMTTVPDGPRMRAQGACTIQMVGQIERSIVAIQSGGVPLTTKTLEEFDISVPGRLETWETAPGHTEFRFIPENTFAEAHGRFKTIQTNIRPMIMVPPSTTVEGKVVGGMGTWYLHGKDQEGQIIPQNLDVVMRGKVTSSTDPNLVAGTENVPVAVLPVPIVATKEQGTRMPVFTFLGRSLWAPQGNKAPFSAKGTLVFNHREENNTVLGTVTITFQVDPTK